MEAITNLSDWLERVLQAASRKEIFAILDQFRILDWTDEERAQMSKLYIRRVLDMPSDAGEDAAAKGINAENNDVDGPVWYEKM